MPLMELALFALPVLLVLGALAASRRRQSQADARQRTVAVGDHVVTAGGILGHVRSLADDVTRVEIAPGVVVEMDRRAVMGAVPPDLAPARTTAMPAEPAKEN